MPKKILLYYPPNKRSVAIETLCKAVIEAGHEIVVLTLTEKGDFHRAVEKMGIATYATVMERKPSWKYFLKQGRFLVKFSKQNRIDYVWSHLQEANIIAVLAQRFLKAEVVCFRHHAESAFYAEYGAQFRMIRNRNEGRMDRLINKLANKIVVLSSGAWYGMEKYEQVNMKKVVLIPLIYDFSRYNKPDPEKVKDIRGAHSCKLLLIMVSRFISSKQHQPVFEIMNKLVKEGLKIKMIVMDEGPLRHKMEEYSATHQLENNISFVGFKKDFINYMAAADLLMHPSLTEASSNVIKEMGLLEKTVAVCKDVGDFNDYIRDGENGFMIDRNELKTSIETIIRKAYANKQELESMGKELKKEVIRLFSNSSENKKKFIELIKN